MKEHFSPQELAQTLQTLQGVCDGVRLVDASRTELLSLSPEGMLGRTGQRCYTRWGFTECCEDCGGMRSLREKCAAVKFLQTPDGFFSVTMSPLRVGTPEGNTVSVVLEQIHRLSDLSFREDESGENVLGLFDKARRRRYLDPLTGCWNRHYLDEYLFLQYRADVIPQRLALILLDLVDFRDLNRESGHAAGDYLLKQAACSLRSNVGPSDSVIRFGGDEFLVALPDCTPERANAAMAFLRQQIGRIRLSRSSRKHLRADFGCVATASFQPDSPQLESMLLQLSGRVRAEAERRRVAEEECLF